MLRYLLAAGVGAMMAYFLDPDKGVQRREAAAKQLADIAQRSADHVDEVAQHTASTTQELLESTAHLKIESVVTPDIPARESFPYTLPIHNSNPYH